MDKKDNVKKNKKSTGSENKNNVKSSNAKTTTSKKRVTSENAVKSKKVEKKNDIKRTNAENKSTKRVNNVNASKVNASVASATNELRKLSIILISIVGVICIFYIITIVLTKKDQNLKYQITDDVSLISYTDILASDIFDKDGSYYVLVKDNEDFYINLYETYISSYVSSDDHLPVYYVDLNDALNQNYKAEQNNLSRENLQFKGTTLLKISSNNIDASYETSDSINEYLKSLVTD